MGIWNGHFERYDEDWLRTYSYLRAVEWLGMPFFFAQPIAPASLIFFPIWKVIVAQLLLGLAWLPVRYRLLGIRQKRDGNFAPAEFGPSPIRPLTIIRVSEAVVWLVHLKWFIAIGAGVYLYQQAEVHRAVVAALWPLMVLPLSFFGAGGMTGLVQKWFLLAFGFTPATGDPGDCLIRDFVYPNPAPLPTSGS